MEETMKKMVGVVALVAVALLGVSRMASADQLDDIKKAGKIHIAVDLGVPPYGMTDDKMQPTGSDIETARVLAKDWGPNSCMYRPPAPRAFPRCSR
jgi:polar amino acid transport system substrate-binding protein